MVQSNKPSSSFDTKYYYNLNGDRSIKHEGTKYTHYTYDTFGNLTQVQLPEKQIHYLYDGLNRRIAKKEWGTITTRFIWQDQLRVAAELNANGTFRKQFIYVDSVNSPEYMFYNGKKYLFVKDHRGSILQVVDSSTGEVMQKMKYSEFGEVILDTNPGFQPFGFAGGLYDYETKLVRFGARDYDGSTGRWLSKDPIRFDGGDTNLYGYVLNDPVNFVNLKSHGFTRKQPLSMTEM
jgi:RHS repeat-associated protein